MPDLIRNTFLFVLVLFVCSPIARAGDDAAPEEVIQLRHDSLTTWNSVEIGLTINDQKDAASLYVSTGGGKLEELRVKFNLPDNQMNVVVPNELLLGVYEPSISSIQVIGNFTPSAIYYFLEISIKYGEEVPPQNTSCEPGMYPSSYKFAAYYLALGSKTISREIWDYCYRIDEREVTFE